MCGQVRCWGYKVAEQANQHSRKYAIMFISHDSGFKGDEMMNLFEIINITQLKKDYQIESFTLVDFTVGFDDLIYLLFSQSVPDRIDGMFVSTIANTQYIAIAIVFDWSANCVCNTNFCDFGILEFNYHFIRPLKNHIMLIGARCEYHNQDNIDQNVLILDEKGAKVKKLCFGDGIEDCITTAEGSIIVSYFDEGVFGNNGWNKPIGSSGLIVWDTEGNIIWENKKYSIYDCYAMNKDSNSRLWFYYYSDFDLVGTDFRSDIVIHPDISGCNAFALSVTQRKILFSGGYNDSSFYQCSLDISHSKISKKQKVELKIDNRSIEKPICHFHGSKLLFLADNSIYGFYFIG